jgi:hypothetical protein
VLTVEQLSDYTDRLARARFGAALPREQEPTAHSASPNILERKQMSQIYDFPTHATNRASLPSGSPDHERGAAAARAALGRTVAVDELAMRRALHSTSHAERVAAREAFAASFGPMAAETKRGLLDMAAALGKVPRLDAPSGEHAAGRRAMAASLGLAG